jgi:hypothetical protein
MIALKRASSIAVCCLVLGNARAHAQYDPRPYVTSMPPGWHRQSNQTALPPAFRTTSPSANGYKAMPRTSGSALRNSADGILNTSNQPATSIKEQQAADTSVATEISGPSADEPSVAFPATPSALPPDLPARLPVESAIPFNSALTGGSVGTSWKADNAGIKPSLAWRAKAYGMQSGNEASTSRELNGQFDDAVMALLSALSKQNLRVETLNSKAGEVLAAPTGTAQSLSRQRYIFTLCETSPGVVVLKAAPLINNKEGRDLLQQLLRSLSTDMPSRGSL